jgi:hypothetical protein
MDAHQYQWNKQWGELDHALKQLWGAHYDQNAAAARQILDAGGAWEFYTLEESRQMFP